MRGTFGLQWHITDHCDQRCKHCYIWSKTEKKGGLFGPTTEDTQRIIKNFCAFCAEIDCQPSVTVTGGDPILHPNFWDILEQLHARSVPITILGNPFHLRQDNLARMRELGVQRYQVSLDGLRATHDFFRKRGSFKTTLEAIRLVNDSGIASMVMATVSRANWLEMPELAKLCVSIGVKNFAFARYCFTHMGAETGLTPQEYRGLLARMWSVYESHANCKTNFSLKDHLFTAFLYEEGLFTPTGLKGVIYEGCNCGIRHMALLPDGTVYACRRFASAVGNVHTSNFYGIFFSSAMEKYRDYSRFKSCSHCELLQYCRGCPAVAASVSGDFYDKDPQCWRSV